MPGEKEEDVSNRRVVRDRIVNALAEVPFDRGMCE